MAEFEQLNLHPEARIFMEAFKNLFAASASGEFSVEKLRKTFEIVKDGLSAAAKDYEGTREELFADSKEVEGGIPVFVYKPKSANHDSDGVPILIYFHGGGNIMGSRDLVDDTCKMLSSQAGCIVVNVEYRLAPEHKFPAMMNDAYATARWVLNNRSLVGGTSKSKVGVSGDSAGGQIAASVSHQVPGVDFQILIYPWLNPGGEANLPSHEEFKKLAPEGLDKWMLSLQLEKTEDQLDPRFCILRNEKYDQLPPTLFIVAEFDTIRDESYEYSKRLTAAGVDNEVFLVKGAVHGFFTAPGRWVNTKESRGPFCGHQNASDSGEKGAFVELCGQSYAKAVEFINRVGK